MELLLEPVLTIFLCLGQQSHQLVEWSSSSSSASIALSWRGWHQFGWFRLDVQKPNEVDDDDDEEAFGWWLVATCNDKSVT